MKANPDRTLRLLATLTIVRKAGPCAAICAGVGLAAEVDAVFCGYFKDLKLGTCGYETLAALNELAYDGSHHPHLIAKHLGISRALLSHTLRALESAGMIERSRRPAQDRRLVNVRLSEAGRAFVFAAQRDLSSKINKIALRRCIPLNERTWGS